jgi:UDP-3-O-[3-hydroxymyristoyl] glucosamine N-acyltransferase
VGGEISGDPSTAIHGVNTLAEAVPGQLSFYGSGRYRADLAKTRASAVLVSAAHDGVALPAGVARVKVPNPHLAFAKLLALFHPRRVFAQGVSLQAHVHPEAFVASSATVMAGATVEAGARVGERSVLFPGVFLGEGASLGDDCLLYPNVTVREGCQIGSRVILNANCVVGADGFGFAFDAEGAQGPEHYKIPQAGIVRIEDDVEVGACSCIDRATTGETVIGRGTKLDNLVQIAHNVKVGPLSILCAQVGVAGSAELGAGVVLAGQVGVVGHLRIGDMAKVGSQAGVARSVPDGATVTGYPAFEHKAWLRSAVAFEHLGELVKEVRQLRQKVEALEDKNR